MKDDLRSTIRAFVDQAAAELAPATFWREPLVGFVRAADHRLAQLPVVAHEAHGLPQDLLPTAGSVVVVFVPYVRRIARDNYRGTLSPRSWAEAYFVTNRMFDQLGQHLRRRLADQGHQLVAIPATHNFDPVRLVADWSHRHLAVLAGLGKLGRHNLLITAAGCAGRLCSYVTDVPLNTDPGPEHEPCLQEAGHDCLRCVKRCVGSALHADRFDRRACYAQLQRNVGRFPEFETTDVCGKCLVGVPCSHVDPVGRGTRHSRR
jgi:epoxyqueuosine reductase QueG